MPTAASLREQWRLRTEPEDVLGFYSEKREHGFCSNFFICKPQFEFHLPPMLQRTVPLTAKNGFVSPVLCDCSEKAIMLCKAAVMGDCASYQEIVRSSSPAEAKRLGRKVKPFDPARWDSVVCCVATDVLWMKFSRDPALRRALLGTRHRVLAEATRYDQIWGIGLDKNEEAMYTPAKWKGANILGWALMQVRAKLLSQAVSIPQLTGQAPKHESNKVGSQRRRPHHTLQRDEQTPQKQTPAAAAASALPQQDFLDDDALLAIDIDGIVASASGKRLCTTGTAAPSRPRISTELREDPTFLDDSALLAIDLDGLLAAASPTTHVPDGLTPDQAAKGAGNTARPQPHTTLGKGTKHSTRQDGSSSDEEEQDPDDPDGSIAALFAAEKSAAGATRGVVGAQHAHKRRRVEDCGNDEL